MSSKIFIGLLFCCMIACKYDSEEELYPAGSCAFRPNNCFGGELPEPGMSGYIFQNDPSEIRYAHGSPNNDLEFIYYKSPDTQPDGVGKLFKYNIGTLEKLLIFSGNLLSSPSWGKNGWVLLNPSDRKLWRIKDNGDSLQVLDDSFYCSGGLWNNLGDKFMYGWQNEQLNYVGLPVRNNNWQLIDTLSGGGLSWYDNLLIGRGDEDFSVHVLNVDNQQTFTIPLQSNPSNGAASGDGVGNVCWSADGQTIYVTSTSGLFSYDYHNQVQSFLRCKCVNEYYFNLGPWGYDHLIASKDHWHDLGNSEIKITSKIVRIKLDGSEEEEIDLAN